MKESLFEYYPPEPSGFKRLWTEGLIVLDANVLLNLYRLPTTARGEFLNVLELLKSRLWIPYQVALEFQRNRLSVITTERKFTEDALQAATNLVSALKQKVDALQIDKRGIGIEAQPLLDDLDRANEKLIEAIRSAHNSQLDVSPSDSVREKLDSILNSRVGPKPKDQADLDRLTAKGEERFKDRTPPGFSDADKEKNPNEAAFIHDHIKYERKFGDLILWRQIIDYVKEKSIKAVLFVTGDRKDDWWWREQGKTIGPHPELIREISREGLVEIFWMYSSDQFLSHAVEYSSATVSSQSVDELKQVAQTPAAKQLVNWSHQGGLTHNLASSTGGIRSYSAHRSDLQDTTEIVGEWIAAAYGETHPSREGFPDYLAEAENGIHGFDVKYVRQFRGMLFPPHVIQGMLRGYLELNEGRLSQFTMIVVIGEPDFFTIVEGGLQGELTFKLKRLLGKYPISGIVVGSTCDVGFLPLAHVTGSSSTSPDKD